MNVTANFSLVSLGCARSLVDSEKMVERLQNVKPEDLTENSVLLGSPARMIETLKKVEAAGVSEVILYFNVGLKPHAQVKEEMDRFMREVAPAFEGAHKQRAA